MRQDPKAAVGSLFSLPLLQPDRPPPPLPHEAETPEKRGHAGAEAALRHADEVMPPAEPGWGDRAMSFARVWMSGRTEGDFAIEDIREAFEQWGNPPPPNNNAWGAIGRRIVKDCLAIRTGAYRQARIKSSNARAVSLYRYIGHGER